MKTVLRMMLVASAISAIVGFQPASAQEIQLKASLFAPPGNPLVKAMDKWTEDLKAKSNGRLVIKVFPASQMGPPPRQFDLARTGVADISVPLHGATPGRFPLTEMTHVPGMTKGVYGASLGLSEIAAQAFATVMNLAAYNALPPDLKALIDEDNGAANARLFARMLADDEIRLRDGLVKKGIKFTKLADDGTLKQAGNKILEQAIKKASANGVDASKALEQIRAATPKYEGQN